MTNEKNPSLEEYKILKEEAKLFTNQSFRDFQLFIGLIAIFFALINSKDSNIPKYASYSFMQLAVFIFLAIQFNRGAYLLIVRNHLIQLERRMNDSSEKNDFFEWESKIIPHHIAPPKSYISISQLILGFTYLLIFIILWVKSYSYSFDLTLHELHIQSEIIFYSFLGAYYLFLGAELAFVIYSIAYAVKQSKLARPVKKKKSV